MPSTPHSALVRLGVKWLQKNGFGVVASELSAAGCQEQPDVVGFRSSCSAVVEVKVSRSDFLADAKKMSRAAGRGVGVYRFYLCPTGVIQPSELPAGWGLLYEAAGKVVDVVRPQGNLWPGFGEGEGLGDWVSFQHSSDLREERSLLYSIARRLSR